MSADGTGRYHGVGRRREQAIAETFVVLADTLVDDYDVVDLLDQLVNVCVDLLAVTAAGLLLDDQKGNLAVVASSSEESQLIQIFQLQNNDGPCLDCVRAGAAVTSGDLHSERSRWPLFVPAALAAGFQSVVAVPLRLRGHSIGGLNMFHARDGLVSEDDQRLAQAFADVATIGILQRRSAARSAMVAEQLQHAVNSRVIIEQAKGVLAERHTASMDAAFGALRRYARNSNRKLTEVALAVVRGEISPSLVAPGPPVA